MISSSTSISLASSASSSTTAGIPVLTMRRSGGGLRDWRRRRRRRERKPLGTHDPSWRSHRRTIYTIARKATTSFLARNKKSEIGAALEVFEAFRSDSSRVTCGKDPPGRLIGDRLFGFSNLCAVMPCMGLE